MRAKSILALCFALTVALLANSCARIEVGIVDKVGAIDVENKGIPILEDALKNGTAAPEVFARPEREIEVALDADNEKDADVDTEDTAEGEKDSKAESEVTIEREQLDYEKEEKAKEFAKALAEHREVWELVNPYSWGYYENGYTFFDIDLDGEPEFLTQSGGGTMADCTTRVYKLSDEKIPYLYGEGLFSYKDLTLYKDKRENGEWMYIENRYGRIGSERDFTFTGKFGFTDGVYSFDEYFSVVNDYDADGNAVNITYKFAGEPVPEQDYISLYESFFGLLKKKKVYAMFVSQSEVGEAEDDGALRKILADSYALYESEFELQEGAETTSDYTDKGASDESDSDEPDSDETHYGEPDSDNADNYVSEDETYYDGKM